MQARNTSRRGFTLIELLVMIFIVAILISLLTVGMRFAIAAARKAAGTQDVNSIKIGVETFRNDFGFVPPLVKDGFPGTPGGRSTPLFTDAQGRRHPTTYLSDMASLSERQDDREYLKADPGAMDPASRDYRFSNYTLAYYLMAHLPQEIDGVEGPEAKVPQRNGSFERATNDTYAALFQPKSGQVTYAAWTANEQQSVGRWELQDRNGVPYRFYRWLPAEAGDSGHDPNNPLANLRVPKLFGDALNDQNPDLSPAADRPEFRDAEYAIVAAGADRVFGDISPDGANPRLESAEEIFDALGKQFSSDAAAENAARADNIVEVGR